MPTSSKQHKIETRSILLNILCSQNTDADVNDTQFTVTCHISICVAQNRHTPIQLKGMSYTQTSPQEQLNINRWRKLDPVYLVLCGSRLLWASPTAVKYTTTKQPVRFHTSLNAAQVTGKHPADICGNSCMKYYATSHI